MWRVFFFSLVITIVGCGGGGDDSSPEKTKEPITPSVETSPSFNNNTKMPVIWLHPTDTALSVVIGAAHQEGIEVYDLQGNQLYVIPGGNINNVDLRYHFSLNSKQVTLITVSNRTDNTLELYTINHNTRQLTKITEGTITPNILINALCMYHSSMNGKYYVVIMNDNGIVQQWELFQTGEGTVKAHQVRDFKVSEQTAGCVADDEYAHLYIASETAILKYSAEPQDNNESTMLDTSEKIANLALYYANGKTGYLIASNPNDSNFLVYQRGNDNAFHGHFTITSGNDIDGVEKASGISVTNVALNQIFPQGLLIVQDTHNTEPEANDNYKLVPWERIAHFLNLKIDTTVNPRHKGLENERNIVKQVQATIETKPVPVGGDAADDLAIWIHPQDTQLSTIIGTQKQGGLIVYDLTGEQIQYLQDGRLNNVDLRSHFPLGNETVTLVAASNRTNNSIALYQVNPRSRHLENIAARTIIVNLEGEIYGLCMYRNLLTNQHYVFVNNKKGAVEQWQVFDDGHGQVDAVLVRSFNVGSQTEGCVVDDYHRQLYIGEEDVGIWKYNAALDGGETRIQVDTTGVGGHLSADVEGLTIYEGGEDKGYLIASSQGNNSFTVYQRSNNNEYLGTFQIVANNTLNIDGVSDTDGIDVVSNPLGTAFPYGVFVAQDGHNRNPAENQDFKLVPWEKIANTLGLQ
jgi:3-phytase